MRLKPGRPDLEPYRTRFGVPEPSDDSPVTVTFLGVSTLLIEAGESAMLTDGFFSRPGLLPVGIGRIAPDRRRIRACLDRLGVRQLVTVVPVHTHFDHVLDSAVVAELTGATLVGGGSAANVGRGHGLPEERLTVVDDRDTLDLGAFTVTFVESEHCPPDRFPGGIEAPLRSPARARAYRCGEAWSLLVEHSASGRTMLVQGSAGFRAGRLVGHSAAVAYLGVGQLGVQPEPYIRQYWSETVRAVGARRVVLIHWDDFFRPLDQPLRALPYAGDDLDVTMRVLSTLAAEDGVVLRLPTVWERADPWAG
ncbi:MAG TPA: MBL fold metallo-hydrolase [Frankiaceae bacterium]|nr:MBL fold metallo-hydrolase [Frankiaceae bacterium]